ncbi:MAG: bifunctional chorismate mutase/prephenate dehydratase [Clostridiales bacterium]|nr:bifunctional chorismate mutase/prephenate dehydratase [Clostridiales bacterium]
MDLTNIRETIDRIDDEIVRLFVERMNAVSEVAAQKKQASAPIKDHARERSILNRVTAAAGDTYAPYVRTLYNQMFDLSRSYQSTRFEYASPLAAKIEKALAETSGKHLPDHALVACQGTEGAYSQQACEKLFAYPDILYFESFDGVFNAVEKGMCQYGILPIENSTAGSVTQVYDLMEKHDFHIVGAQKLRVEHHLMRKNRSDTPIREVVSHEQALMQCSEFLKANPAIKVTKMANTAVAAEFVANSDRDDIAVLASRSCAELYGLHIIDSSVNNSQSNYTRFICIARKPEIYPFARKISLMMVLKHEPGALNAVVSRLALEGVNLLKLESRPMPGREFEFRFFFDLEASVADPDIVRILCELESHADHFVFLGCYEER